jgi:hypothetical protein
MPSAFTTVTWTQSAKHKSLHDSISPFNQLTTFPAENLQVIALPTGASPDAVFGAIGDAGTTNDSDFAGRVALLALDPPLRMELRKDRPDILEGTTRSRLDGYLDECMGFQATACRIFSLDSRIGPRAVCLSRELSVHLFFFWIDISMVLHVSNMTLFMVHQHKETP